MQFWLASLLGGLVSVAGTIVGRVLIALGISAVVFTGVDSSLVWARDYLLTSLQGLPTLALQVASTLKVGVCVSILTSALAARLLLAGLQGGSIRRLTGV